MDIRTFYPKQGILEKKVSLCLLSPMCWSIHHRTTVYIDNSTKVKNRDISLIGPGHMLKTGTVPAKTGRMVSLLILLEIKFLKITIFGLKRRRRHFSECDYCHNFSPKCFYFSINFKKFGGHGHCSHTAKL